ncbi:MAG TPA: ABC transporter ATP-binding protein [Clostridiaceae bacterium]|nr:ABC transporter ATP-binding protein [Clostridiaceae bacterium]
MLKKYIKPYTKRIVVNACVKMTGTLMEVVLPAILAHIINVVVPTRNQSGIILWGLAMVVFSFGAWVLNFSANRMASGTASRAVRSIRQDLFARAMRLSARQMDELTVSSLESRLTSDTYALHRFLGATLRMGIRSLMLFVGGVFFCFWLSWRLALILLVLVVPLFFAVRFVYRRAIPLFHTVQRKIDDMVQIIRENIRGIRVIKALDRTDYEKERFSVANEDVRAAEVRAIDQIAMMSPLVNIILYTGLAAVLILGARLVNVGLLQTGTVMAFLSYFILITNSLLGLNRMFNIYNRAVASIERIREVLTMLPDENQLIAEGVSTVKEADSAVPEIEFRNVSFSYLGVKDDLQNVSFSLYPGETLGIMGPTGSGKSTIIRLLLRQYDVQEGEILIRGKDIRTIKPEALSHLFGIVFQNDFLFGGTVRKNIDFGRGLSDESIREATEYAQASTFLKEKEDGLDFILASKGVNLSGGEKQRLLLSRALAGEPEILILDDASSALDFRTDAKLRSALRDHYTATTSIIIAQRVSSVRHADQIIFMENGRISAMGDHETMMKESCKYREIAEMQMGEWREVEAIA